MNLKLSNRVLIASIAILLIFILLRGFQFTESITGFLRDHFWDAIF